MINIVYFLFKIHESYAIGRWLPHQQYLISNLSEPVKVIILNLLVLLC